MFSMFSKCLVFTLNFSSTKSWNSLVANTIEPDYGAAMIVPAPMRISAMVDTTAPASEAMYRICHHQTALFKKFTTTAYLCLYKLRLHFIYPGHLVTRD